MASRRYLVALNKTIKACELDESGADALVIEFARDLARRLDGESAKEAPLNLLRMFQAATKDVLRAAERVAAEKRQRDGGESPSTVPSETPGERPPLRAVEESPLAKLRKQKSARQAAGKDRASAVHEASA